MLPAFEETVPAKLLVVAANAASTFLFVKSSVVSLLVIVIVLLEPDVFAVKTRRKGLDPVPSLMIEAVTLPPAELIASRSPCRVVDADTVTLDSVPELPTLNLKVPAPLATAVVF